MLVSKPYAKIKQEPVDEFNHRDDTYTHEQTKAATNFRDVVKYRHLIGCNELLDRTINKENVDNPDVIFKCIIRWILLNIS